MSGTVFNPLFKLDFGYFANSNVQTITNDLNSPRTLTLTYDNLNRWTRAETTATSGPYCWGQVVPPWSGDPNSQGYDRYGNLMIIDVTKCSAPSLSVSVNIPGYYFNQITSSGYTYDASGNMTADTVNNYTWNYAGQLKTAGSTTYKYDGDGKRVMNSGGTYFWPDFGGDHLSDTPGSGAGNEYIFFAGQRVAWVDSTGTPRFYWTDHLGTSRMVTDGSGNICYDADYYLFQGERPPYVNTCPPAYKFAGMKYDSESTNYYTLNRYYPARVGRWLSPDPLAGDASNPQSLNRYAYVLNNPTTLTDPLGLEPCDPFIGPCSPGCDPIVGLCDPFPPCDPSVEPCAPGPGPTGGSEGGGLPPAPPLPTSPSPAGRAGPRVSPGTPTSPPGCR